MTEPLLVLRTLGGKGTPPPPCREVIPRATTRQTKNTATSYSRRTATAECLTRIRLLLLKKGWHIAKGSEEVLFQVSKHCNVPHPPQLG